LFEELPEANEFSEFNLPCDHKRRTQKLLPEIKRTLETVFFNGLLPSFYEAWENITVTPAHTLKTLRS
jgi:hypothetical protein